MLGTHPATISHRTSVVAPTENDSSDLDWTLALAGGEGVRLGDYVAHRFGQRMPKQYCRFVGRRSMLEHTLDRLAHLTPAARTLVVIGTQHRPIATGQLLARADHVFCQPASRDTGLALYVALAMIKRYHPNAVVTVTPCDHYVAPAARYIEIVRAAREVARARRDTCVVLGAPADGPEPDFGYLVLGDTLVEVPEVRRVTGFVEKPSPALAAQLLAGGGSLWNTMVVCATVDALWQLGRATQPGLMDILDALVPLIGSIDEDDAIDYVYRALLPVGFSRDMLEQAPERIAAMALAGVTWSDWGRPERIEAVLATQRTLPRGALRDRDRERGAPQLYEP